MVNIWGLRRQKSAFQLLLLFAGFTCLYYFKSVKYSAPDFSPESTNTTRKKVVAYDEMTKVFNQVVNEYCNSKETKLGLNCLEKLSELDARFKDTHENPCDKCTPQNTPVYHHTFWQLNELKSETAQFYRRTIFLNIMSYLATQNLCCTKFIFWKLKEFPQEIEDEIRKKFAYYIKNKILEIKLFDMNEIVCANKGSSFQGTRLCGGTSDSSLAGRHLISLSDLVRFVVLDAYGGIYTDGDVIYLKDMYLLWEHNFAYRWSYTQNYNTAVLGVNKRSASPINLLLKRIISPQSDVNQLIASLHPYALSNTVRGMNSNNIYGFKPLHAFHSFLFDPAWTCFDGVTPRLRPDLVCGFDDFNNKKMIDAKDFDPKIHPTGGGSFTYHLHLVNCGTNIRDDSFFSYFENYYQEVLKKFVSI